MSCAVFSDRKLGAYALGTWFAQAELDSQKSASKGGSHPAPGRAKRGVRMFTIAMMAVSGWTLVPDYRRPDLNEWYAGLRRKGSSFGCCSKEDCHTTEAQLRGRRLVGAYRQTRRPSGR